MWISRKWVQEKRIQEKHVSWVVEQWDQIHRSVWARLWESERKSRHLLFTCCNSPSWLCFLLASYTSFFSASFFHFLSSSFDFFIHSFFIYLPLLRSFMFFWLFLFFNISPPPCHSTTSFHTTAPSFICSFQLYFLQPSPSFFPHPLNQFVL